MQIQFLKSKIGHATVTEAELHYEGSITVDEKLIQAVDIVPGEKVAVLNLNNGQRFETYIIAGKPNSGQVCLNGPAARCGLVGDRIIIISYASATPDEAKSFQPKIIHLDGSNRIKS